MSRSFLRGIWLGLFGSLAMLGGFVFWIYRYTQKVPFPVHRPAEGEITFRLVPTHEVPKHWATWRVELEPLCEALRALWTDAHEQLMGISARYHRG